MRSPRLVVVGWVSTRLLPTVPVLVRVLVLPPVAHGLPTAITLVPTALHAQVPSVQVVVLSSLR